MMHSVGTGAPTGLGWCGSMVFEWLAAAATGQTTSEKLGLVMTAANPQPKG